MAQRYSVLAQAEVTLEIVVIADSPEEAVAKARHAQTHPPSRAKWRQVIDHDLGTIDTVTEKRKDGRAFSVEYNHRREHRCEPF